MGSRRTADDGRLIFNAAIAKNIYGETKMKLATFTHKGKTAIGLVRGDRVVRLLAVVSEAIGLVVGFSLVSLSSD